MPAIKIAGRGKAKPAARKAATAPTRGRGRPKATPTRRSATPKAAATQTGSSSRRPTTHDEKVIKRHIKALEQVGEEYREAQDAHKDAVNAVYEATREAMDEGVPTGVIVDSVGMSRQWLYNMDKHAGRNGKGKATSGRRAAKTTAPKSTTRKSSSRPKIRTRG